MTNREKNIVYMKKGGQENVMLPVKYDLTAYKTCGDIVKKQIIGLDLF